MSQEHYMLCSVAGDLAIQRRVLNKVKDRLLEKFGAVPQGAGLKIYENPHDFGTYLSLDGYWNTSLPDGQQWVFLMEMDAAELAEKLEAEAKEQLQEVLKARPSFEEWMKTVDIFCSAKCGLSIHDLPDMDFRSSYEAGTSAEEFINGIDLEEVLMG